MPLKAHSFLPEGCLDAPTPTVGAMEPPQMYHFVSPWGGLGGCGRGGSARVDGVHVGRSCRRPIWQAEALLRSYVAKTKSAVPNSLLDTITFIIMVPFKYSVT